MNMQIDSIFGYPITDRATAVNRPIIFSITERESLKWRILDEIYQDYAQHLSDPQPQKKDIIETLKQLENISDYDLVNEYADILSRTLHFNQESIQNYCLQFPAEEARVFLQAIEEGKNTILKTVNISLEEIKKAADEALPDVFQQQKTKSDQLIIISDICDLQNINLNESIVSFTPKTDNEKHQLNKLLEKSDFFFLDPTTKHILTISDDIIMDVKQISYKSINATFELKALHKPTGLIKEVTT